MQEYKKTQYICYGANGVCRIEDVGPIPGMHAQARFYTLKPLSDEKSVYYIPVDSETLTSKMRPLLTRGEINASIDSAADAPCAWIEDRTERHETCRSALRESDPRRIMRIAGMLYLRRQQLADEGKKLSATDEMMLKQAESLIENEFSFVLGLKNSEVGPYIRTRLGLE